ncbi:MULTISPECIES: hypothetical protein [Corynebacterium]|uniref:Uncharacterized protein n=1 Tax=Corynebacterium hadale TaxID=2026255 RepID=A0A269PFB2_9CORY|nr:hypothetical protein [Corynebacterium hadale]PAJ70931.1 hypothetical protein CIG21_01745 [Corynebacterium hadale]WKC60808.1 Phage tail repeat like protein [Corynebacterium hadale]
MISLLIDIQDVLGIGVPGDTVTLEAPAARPAEDGGVVRPYRRIIELDDEGRATVEVEPGPIQVIFHDEVDRQVILRGIVPRDRDVVTLRELIVADIGTVDDVPGIRDALDGKADKDHRHTISDVDELADTLASKASTESLENLDNGKADKEHRHQIADIDELENRLATVLDEDDRLALEQEIALKAPTGHRHTIHDVDDLKWSLDQKLNTDDFRVEVDDIAGQRIAELVDGAPESLDTLREVAGELASQDDAIAALFAEIGKRAMSKHSHAIGDVNGLQSALDGKASKSHSHAIADVNGLEAKLDLKADASALSRTVESTVPVLYWRQNDTWDILGGAPEGYRFWSIGRLYPTRGWFLVITVGETVATLRSETNQYVNLEMRKPVDIVHVDEGGFFLCQSAQNRDGIVLIPLARGLL